MLEQTTCANQAHEWQARDGPEVVCALCAMPALCRSCILMVRRSSEGLPPIFCVRHQSAEEVRVQWSIRELAQRCAYLGTTASPQAWSANGALFVERPIFRLEYTSLERPMVQVLPLDSPVPVFSVDGALGQAVALHFQVGPWIEALLETWTLRDGRYVCGDTGCVGRGCRGGVGLAFGDGVACIADGG